VIGDFNVTAWSTYFRELVDQGDFANSQHGFALWPTWHAGLPLVMRIPIDQCLHSRDLATVARQVGPDVGSDHLPLLVNLRLRSSHARPPE
jgi:endonuclease/exonuclease/phosphatase (EEP) superfamily protein YafD